MAAVGEAFLSSLFQVLIDRLVTSLPDWIRGHDIENDLKTFKRKLMKVTVVLNDAEDKQFKNEAVKMWLDELKDATYDAEDVLDEIATEALRWKLEAESGQTSTNRVLNLISDPLNRSDRQFNADIESKMKAIAERFDDLAKDISELRLNEIVSGSSSMVRETSSVVDDSCVYGRDDDKEKIIELLLKDEPKISVISIVGMGGIGKTTLAQIVYNDPRLVRHFDLKAWTCVSDEFDVKRITKSILNSVGVAFSDFDDLDPVQVKLKEALAGKKFLIVLDDVWSKKRGHWDALQTPFRVGAPGSKIIVTTRIKDVPSKMGTTVDSHYDLEYLSIDDCWSVFVQHAFGSGYIEAKPKLVEIGKKIVEKCKGLPLAAKTLGGLLCSKPEEDEWEEILNSKIWGLPEEENDTLPALKLSYHHLPSHLKRCFAYCSIFPKDYEFEVVELVLLWIAEGLVLQPDGRKQMEDIGMGYFRDLLSRSFFQPSSNNKLRFVMHDLINDLAQWVAGKTCFKLEDTVDGEEKYKVLKKARHSSYIGRHFDGVKKFEAFNEVKWLRTFLSLMTPSQAYLTNYVPLELLPKLRCLRVLSLARYRITNVPNSIGDLKHLRYLDLSYTQIRSLPESTSSLYNLQVLNLRDCSLLMELPTRIRNLINLRLLDITNATSIKEMPPGMGKLTSLQKLSHFIVGSNSGSGIRELEKLNHLRGTLCISRLENVFDDRDAWGANLKDKKDLDGLRIKWCSPNDDSTNEEVVKQVLDMLRPHNKLKELTIECYGGTKFPTWVGDPSFFNMVLLRLEECVNCTSLPSLGQLPLLKDLYIKGMNKVNIVDLDFYGEGCPKPFPSLETLSFEDMQEWERWAHSGDNGLVEAFLCLRKLSIKRCPKLLGKLPDHLPSLEEFIIYECHLLVISISSLPKLLRFNIDKCNENPFQTIHIPYLSNTLILSDISELMRLAEGFMQGLTEVENLTIVGCEKMTSLWQNEEKFLQNLASLSNLKIEGCPEFVSLVGEEAKQQQQQLGVPCGLVSLELHQCDNLKNLLGLHGLTSLRRLTINHCPKLVSFPESGLPCGLESLDLHQCDNLKNLLGLHGLTSLRHMTIDRCPKLVSFPESGLPCGLEFLKIEESHSLTSIARGHLPSTLLILEIENCKNLESLMDKEEGSSSTTTATSRSKKRRTATSLHNKSNNNSNSASLLKGLFISGCDSLRSISSGDELPVTLEDLEIYDCPKLESIVDSLHNNSALKSIRIEDCESLKSFPKGLHNLTHLSSMSIWKCPSLVYFFPCGRLPSIKRLFIDCRQVESIGEMLHHNTCIESVKFSNCESLKALPEGSHNLTHLSSIVLENCSSLISFPKGGLPATNLRELRISGCEKLEALPDRLHNLTSLQKLVIKECPGFKSFPEEGFPTYLRELDIGDFKFCEKLFEWGLHKLTSLQSLCINGGCPDVVSFPEEEKGMILPTSLRKLWIRNFPNLEYLSSEGFQNLNSLEELTFLNCTRLKSFPEEGLPPSLLQLRISCCPLLQRRCKKDQGPDWPKIAYVPCLFSLDNSGRDYPDTTIGMVSTSNCPGHFSSTVGPRGGF